MAGRGMDREQWQTRIGVSHLRGRIMVKRILENIQQLNPFPGIGGITILVALCAFLGRAWFVDFQGTMEELKEHEMSSSIQWEKFRAADALQEERYTVLLKKIDSMDTKIDRLVDHIYNKK
jgi:hypothetical protein